MEEAIYGIWSDICLLWERVERDPQERFWSVQSVCFCISSHLCSLCCWWHVPPTDKLLGLCVCVWGFVSASVCLCLRASPPTHAFAFYTCRGKKKYPFHPSCCHRVLQTSKNKEVPCRGGWESGGGGVCCLFMWHRQNITCCRCKHAVCFALRYCSNKGCGGNTRKCLSTLHLKLYLTRFFKKKPITCLSWPSVNP